MELQGSLYINLYSTEYQALSADDNFVYNSLATAQNKIAYFHKKKGLFQVHLITPGSN